ncbi:hypothetical protein llap_10503 [Limosa lapponica baueri]|uniref:Uncharacterized protein n=1 Tax=Limosa lapponica baueri TaxID=1758121 RepID=A0A2I0TZE9_LIMLA|nr:hypothetical protein llap_10503 [Limosa lapponica baueri]
MAAVSLVPPKTNGHSKDVASTRVPGQGAVLLSCFGPRKLAQTTPAASWSKGTLGTLLLSRNPNASVQDPGAMCLLLKETRPSRGGRRPPDLMMEDSVSPSHSRGGFQPHGDIVCKESALCRDSQWLQAQW